MKKSHPLHMFKARRQRLLDAMAPGIAIIQADKIVSKNNGNEYPFHQLPNFYYLTGSHEPEAILVLQKSLDNTESTLYVRPKDATAEMWTGRRLGPDASKDAYDVDHAFSLNDFTDMLPKLLKGHRTLYIDVFNDNPLHKKVFSICRRYQTISDPDSFIPQTVVNLDFILAQLRLLKDDDECRAIRHAVAVSTVAYKHAMAYCEPGKNERDLQNILNFAFCDGGGDGAAYLPIVASGENATIMHYVENNHELVDGDLVLIDAGAEVNGVACDITRTFPVNGTFSEAQRQVYTIVLNALKAGINAVKHGATLADIDSASKRVLTKGLIELGVLKGSLKKHLKERSIRPYCPYGVSHWLGLNIHDRCALVDSDGVPRNTLRPGMIFTIEPGLYFPSDDEAVPEVYRGLGIRIEDDILITEDGFENLTEGVIKEIDHIETACARPFSGLANQRRELE